MAIERNKTALEFETMLRRHLKSGGAPVAACAGFDFDAASAYLENALGESHRAGFESHLAGCATCRCHLIELARLAQTAPHAGRQPAPVADQAPAWVRWRGVAAGWFDLSSWNMKWQMAGVAGAAFAILIAALGVQSWRQISNPNQLAVSVDTAAPASVAVSDPSPTPEPSLKDQSLIAEMESVAAQPTRARGSVPTPVVGPSPGDIAVPAPSNEAAKLNQNPQSGILVFDPPISRRDATQSRIIPPGINQVNSGPVDIKVRPQPTPPGEDPKPPTESNATKSDQEAAGKTPTEKSPSRFRRSVDEFLTIINPLPPIKPDIKREAQTLVPSAKRESKPESTRARPTPKPADDESAKPLKHRIRDKVFVYHRDINMWIDEAYRKETMEFRLLRLERGSKAYEDVLAKDPQLKEFFDHGPILIVWKNKIYKVK